jgi:hypothetical protein
MSLEKIKLLYRKSRDEFFFLSPLLFFYDREKNIYDEIFCRRHSTPDNLLQKMIRYIFFLFSFIMFLRQSFFFFRLEVCIHIGEREEEEKKKEEERISYSDEDQ